MRTTTVMMTNMVLTMETLVSKQRIAEKTLLVASFHGAVALLITMSMYTRERAGGP